MRIREHYLKLLHDCGGYYECPRDAAGRRVGPLVGYAGKYTAADYSLKNFVGDIYANWAAVEEHPRELEDLAYDLLSEVFRIVGEKGATVFCGAPSTPLAPDALSRPLPPTGRGINGWIDCWFGPARPSPS